MARILIVEQSDEVRELLAHQVTRLGHEPLLYAPETGELPEAEVALVEPALGDGLAVARSLRARWPDLPLVFVSIYPKTPELAELSPSAYLVKPFGLSELAAAVDAALVD